MCIGRVIAGHSLDKLARLCTLAGYLLAAVQLERMTVPFLGEILRQPK